MIVFEQQAFGKKESYFIISAVFLFAELTLLLTGV